MEKPTAGFWSVLAQFLVCLPIGGFIKGGEKKLLLVEKKIYPGIYYVVPTV